MSKILLGLFTIMIISWISVAGLTPVLNVFLVLILTLLFLVIFGSVIVFGLSIIGRTVSWIFKGFKGFWN